MWLHTSCDLAFDIAVPTPFVLMLTDDDNLKLSSDTWTEVQRRLAADGHYSGTADGLLGPGTKRTLFAYAPAP